MKMKLFLILIALIILTGCGNSDQITGYWIGSMGMNGKTVDIEVFFNSENPSFSSKETMVLEEPISNLKIKNGRISFAWITDDQLLFAGTVKNEKINGTVNIQGAPSNMKFIFDLARKFDSLPVKSYAIEKLTIKSKSANLSANIYVPKTKKMHPALVLLHGSGPQTKNLYTYYADFFVKLGCEVLIFDKRGAGASTGNHWTASYNDLAEDAIACLETMKNRGSVDKSKIGLWGYSQGASLLPLIVTKTDIPTFLIAKSPEVISVPEASAYADSLKIINRGYSSEDADIVAESHRKVGQMIRDGSDYKEVEDFIRQNARKYSFMDQTGLFSNITINKDEFEGFYWRGRAESFYSYWKNIKMPTLVLFGEDDEYVNSKSNKSIIESFNNSKITIKLFPRAGHNLKKAFNPSKYPDFDLPRAIPEYLDFVEKWLENEIKK